MQMPNKGRFLKRLLMALPRAACGDQVTTHLPKPILEADLQPTNLVLAQRAAMRDRRAKNVERATLRARRENKSNKLR